MWRLCVSSYLYNINKKQAQADFEITLINGLKGKEVTHYITQIIIQTITSGLCDKFKFYDNIINQLQTANKPRIILQSQWNPKDRRTET